MDKIKIVLFICNWGPHAAFQQLQDDGADLPAEVRMIRIPCAGRMSRSLFLKAFEMGADGVALAGCEPGSCRYGSGTKVAERNIDDTGGILDLIGLGRDRLRLAMVLPEESGRLLEFLQDFVKVIETIGRSPVVPSSRQEKREIHPAEAEKLLASHDVYACHDCGKCSSACPLSLSGKPFSPRATAGAIIAGRMQTEAVAKDIWSCLTCGLCHDRCPSAVDFPKFIRDMRGLQKHGEIGGYESHGGVFQSLMRTMTSPDLPVRHWDWLPGDLRTDSNSKVLFFGGCAQYFDTYFRSSLSVQTGQILVDAIKLLNFFDIYPALLNQERCCGHDLLWTGDRENFLKLARLNVDAIQSMGVEEVITSCPECYRTLLRDYPENGVPLPFKVSHIFDVAEREISKGAVGFEGLGRKITFQDPCRLSRLENRPELPRQLIARLGVEEFSEMPERGLSALCCGNCAWVGCDSYTKSIQVKRLQQARDTGSDLLVTACPKCQIHLRCAMQDPFIGEDIRMEMMDLTSILARTIKWA